MKKIVRLTEGDLRRIIKESVNKIKTQLTKDNITGVTIVTE